MAANLTIPTSVGMSHEAFLQFTRDYLEGEVSMEEYNKPGYRETIALNLRRLEGWVKRLDLDASLVEMVRSSDISMNWILLNEPWCVDGAYIQPLLYKISEVSQGRINLKVLLRDQHREIMDRFLTNGGRAIPKLIALNNDNEVLFTYGPRPAELQEQISNLMQDPNYDPNEKLKIGTRWYIRDKGVKIQEELHRILSDITLNNKVLQ